MGDAQVETAISHWAPRLLANGVLLTDFEEVTRSIGRWSDWCSKWSQRAAVHERLGRGALGSGHFLTASEHLSRAAVYYHYAKFVFVDDLDQARAAHMKSAERRGLAFPYLRPPAVRVEIPYDDGRLAGPLRRPHALLRPPVFPILSDPAHTQP